MKGPSNGGSGRRRLLKGARFAVPDGSHERKAANMTTPKEPRISERDEAAFGLAELLYPLVIRRGNARTGKEVIGAFTLYHKAMERDWNGEKDRKQCVRLAAEAIALWRTVPEFERMRICGGWRLPLAMPSAREWAKEQARLMDDVMCFMVASAGGDHTTVGAEFELCRCSTHPVQVRIRPGTDLPDVLAALRNVVETLEMDWPQLITADGLADDDGWMGADHQSFRNRRKTPARKVKSEAPKTRGKDRGALALATA